MTYYANPGYAGTQAYWDYSTSASNSPAPDETQYIYAVPEYQTPVGKRHARMASYASPGTYTSPARFPSPAHYAAHYDYSAPPATRFDHAYDVGVDTPSRSRARRASTTNGQGTPRKSSKSTRSPPKRVAPEATAEDAHDHNIPAGYSLKNWDPNEEPILLLGSAFDANSLGKWIYDWTVYYHKPGAPITEVAGDLWLSLIKFAGKLKRGRECMPRVANERNKRVLDDHLSTGEKVWRRIEHLIQLCEEPMWKGAKKDGNKVSMGEKSGVEFVRTMFGRERQLERTEKLMQSIRLWNMRFDANCEDILRRPSAD